MYIDLHTAEGLARQCIFIYLLALCTVHQTHAYVEIAWFKPIMSSKNWNQ